MKTCALSLIIVLIGLSACTSDESETQKELMSGRWYQDEHWLDEDAIDYEMLEIGNTRLVLNRIFPDDPGAQLPYEKIVLRR